MESPSTRQRGSASVLLLILCVILGAALVYQFRTAKQQRQQDLGTICQLSNRWHDAWTKLDEQKLVNLSLERDLSSTLESANTFSNQVRKDLVKSTTVTKTAPAAPPQPDPKVAELRSERDNLSTQLDDLTAAMAKLDCELTETQRKLQTSEGDRTALLRQLKRLEADRDRLMRQFSDIALVRQQLRRLKDEQTVSRRLEWIRHGVYGDSKGAELLRKSLASATPASRQNYDLNVEVRRDGAATALPVAP